MIRAVHLAAAETKKYATHWAVHATVRQAQTADACGMQCVAVTHKSGCCQGGGRKPANNDG